MDDLKNNTLNISDNIVDIKDVENKEIDDILNDAIHIVANADKNISLNENKNDLDEESQNKNIQDYIKTANTDILRNTLAPQIKANEEKKREHKDKLIKSISYFLGGQFVIVAVLVLLILISMLVFHALKNDYSENVLQMIFAFFGTYIASVIAELLAMLHFIVKEVFNTSISDLMKIFKIDTINEQR